jgi:hypothetical protein
MLRTFTVLIQRGCCVDLPRRAVTGPDERRYDASLCVHADNAELKCIGKFTQFLDDPYYM